VGREYVTVAPFDCELWHDGWPAQPINTLSATAFEVIGLWLWRRGRRLLAALSAAIGVGSVWFHAAPGDAATWAHDVSLYALALVGTVEAVRVVIGRQPPVLAAAIFGVGPICWFFSRTGGLLCPPDSMVQGHAV